MLNTIIFKSDKVNLYQKLVEIGGQFIGTNNYKGGNHLFRKSLVFLLIFLLMFSSAAAGATLPVKEKTEGTKRDSYQISKTEVEEQYQVNDQVRIVVELKDKAAIDYAQEKGVQLKELSPTTKEQLQKNILSSQEKVKSQITSKNIKAEYINNFTTVLNGFSAEVKYGDLAKIESLDNVAGVHIVKEYQRPTEEPKMVYSKELVQAQEAWRDYGYKGEGMIVGVIDTGIDPSHKDMVLTDSETSKLTESKVKESVSTNHLPGKYYTEKVPYGYNYMDENDNIHDDSAGASMHGMHVSGTVGANGDEDNGGIKGIAPEAQLLALKVFGNDPEFPSTFGDIYVKAIDDAIALGADVLNMSLGSTAGFVSADDPEQKAIQKAIDNGILMSISAGNSAHFGNGAAFPNPYAANPDIGVSGSPGLSYNSFQVASAENSFMDLDAINFEYDEVTGKAPFLSASSVHPNDVSEKTFEVAYGGIGNPSELTNVAGKYALIVRGTLDFVVKTKNAQAAGAKGVIIYNNVDGYVNMATDPSITIPQLFMPKVNGDELKEALDAGKTVTISFNGEKTTAQNPEAGKMSAFTSWGLTPNLDFKPEITAPGGQIYSTLENNQYGMMSGTSMAAPHVSGGSALVLERVDEQFKLSSLDRVNMAKNLIMNTAQPLIDKGTVNSAFGWNIPYSPRRQGAGMMQLHSALSTPVVVTEASTTEGKVALKEVGDKFEFTLKAQNYSDADVTYDVAANLQTDFAMYGELGYSANELEGQPILDAEIKVEGEDSAQITVPANETVAFKVQVDVSNAKVDDPSISGGWGIPVDINEVFPNGYFVEGYVTLVDTADTNPELSIPYVGFKGDWNAAPIVDAYADSEETFYGTTGLLDEDLYYLGVDPIKGTLDPKNNAISPNTDGVQDATIPVLSFLRNAKKVEYNILDKDGKKLRTLLTENLIVKNYYDGGLGPMYYLNPAKTWDGKINNKVVEGDYYYEVKATLDYPGATPQSFKMPIQVDTTKPNLALSYENGAVALVAADENGSGIAYFDVSLDGKTLDPLPGDTTEYPLDELEVGQTLTITVVDYAGNTTKKSLYGAEETKPDIHLLTPEAFERYNSKEVGISGYVNEESGIDSLTIAEQEVPVVYNAETKRYEFDTTIKFESDGVQKFDIEAVDGNGNKTSFTRTIFVDSTAPTLAVKGAPANVGLSEKNPKVSLEVKDNFDGIRVRVNGDEVFYNEFKEPFAMRGFDKTLQDIELNLKNGENTFVIEVEDLGGNKVIKEVKITKTDTPTSLPSDQGEFTIKDKEATLAVDASKVEGAIKDASKKEFVVDLSEGLKENIQNLNAEFTAELVKKVADNKKSLAVKTGNATVNVPTSVLADLANVSSGTVKFSVNQVEPNAPSLPIAGAGEQIVSKLYDLNISYSNHGKNELYSNFREPVTVELAVSGSKIKDKRKTAAYYLDEKANKWVYSGGKVADDTVVFSTSHFSKYAVIENALTFKDIQKHWAKDEIEVLASRKITLGKSADKYVPEDKLTRAEFAVLLVRTLNIPTQPYKGIFYDVTEKQSWSVLEIEAANRAGIVKGVSAGQFNPQEQITREQMATMIIRAIQYKDENLVTELPLNKPFSDHGKISEYAKEAVLQATSLGIIKGKTSTTFAPKDKTTRAESAVMLYRLLDTLEEL